VTPADLADAVRAAVRAAIDRGALAVAVPDEVVVERPRIRNHGDYATNVALRLAKESGRPPREVAHEVAARLHEQAGIGQVDVAGPGFLNITLGVGALGELARTVVTAGESYGRSGALAGQRINLEYVSANPTGPIHVGGARWAAVGDALARLFEACGASVTREYYINDAGAQIDRFAASLYAAATGRPTPEDGYHGDYIGELATRITRGEPALLGRPEAKAVEVFRREGVELMVADIRRSLADFGVDFDVFFSERELHASGAIDQAVDRLREAGAVYLSEGALWLRTTDFGDDKDRVIIRADGRPAYFAADLAYYVNKRDRGFDRVVIVLAADHHGYVARLRALVRALGDDPDATLSVPLGQLVSVSGGTLSKRDGQLLTLDELTHAIGVDAARYALVRSSMDTPIDIDLDLWSRQTSDNPVFYVQYAHARLASITRNAAQLGVEAADFDPTLLGHDREAALLTELGEFPRVVAAAAELSEPHRVARYLESLAGAYHRFYDSCRVLPQGDESPTAQHSARLWLCEATRVVLANGLGLLGVTAPERM
jgi:arginyl-tRNA synthetase